MGSDGISKDKPYRVTPGLGEGKWKVYGLDDHDQDRYIGRVVERDGKFYVLDVPTDLPAARQVDSVDKAAEMLYNVCLETGYLKKGSPNYLKSSEEKNDEA